MTYRGKGRHREAVPRLILTVSALLSLLAFAACTRKPSPESVQEQAIAQFRQKTVAEIRQIEVVSAFALFREQDKTSPLAIGEFRRRGTGQSGIEYPTALFPCYVLIAGGIKVIGKENGFSTAGEGRIKMRWCPTPIPKTTPWIRIKTDIRLVWVGGLGQEPLPSPFEDRRSTAIFSVSEIFSNAITHPFKSTAEASDAPDFICYEIPFAWTDGAVAILSGKETPTDEPIEQASPLGTVFCFLHALRAAEANPALVDVPRQQLTALINRKADPLLIETLFYLAIHPATQNPHADDYWDMFITGLKNGSIAKSSGARLGIVFRTFCGLPRMKGDELYALLRNPVLNVTVAREGFASLSAEERRFLVACRMNFIPPRSQRSTTPWPQPPPAPTTAQ